jgi:hypothetical protein
MQPKDKMGKYIKNTMINKFKYICNRVIWKIQDLIG